MNLKINGKKLFEKEITNYVTKNPVTIISNSSTSGEMPIYLAESGYKVIVSGSTQSFIPYYRFKNASKSINKELKKKIGFSNADFPYTSKEYQILFVTFGAELIRQIIENKDNNTVLIIESSCNNINACILFGLVKQLISSGSTLRLVIINSVEKYSTKISDFFNNAPVLKAPSTNYYVAFIRKSAKDIKKVILNNLLYSKYNNILVFLPGENEINQLSKELKNLFSLNGINPKIVKLFSDSSFEDKESYYTCISSERQVILATSVVQNLPTPSMDIDVIVDSGLEKRAKSVGNVGYLKVQEISKFTIEQHMALAGQYSPGLYYLCSDLDGERKEIHYEVEHTIYNTLLAIIREYDLSNIEVISSKSKFHITTALNLLKRIDAIDENNNISEIGLQMATLPMEVRFSRIFIESKKYNLAADILIAYLLFKYGMISDESIDNMAYSLKSDLLGQIYTFKKLYCGCKPENIHIQWSRYQKVAVRFKKLSTFLNIDLTEKTNIADFKKCLSGFSDSLFIRQIGKGYLNESDGSFYTTFTNTALSELEAPFIVGLPLNFIDTSRKKEYFKILMGTTYTTEEVLEYYSDYIETIYYNYDGYIHKKHTYNGVTVQSKLIGTVEELRDSEPDAFSEKKEIDEHGNPVICLYYYGCKINSRPWFKLI